MQQPEIKHWLMLGYLVAAWGFAFALIVVALAVFEPVAVVWLRLLLGAVTLLVIMRCQGKQLPTSALWWRRLTVLAITGNLLPFTLITWAEQSVASSEVGLLMALMPVTTLVLAHYWVDGEMLSTRRIAGIAMGFLGVAVLLGPELRDVANTQKLPGQVAAIMATLCYAVNGIYAKRLPALDGVTIGAGSLMVGTVILGPIALWLQPTWEVGAHAGAVLAILTLGVLATGIATWKYFTLVAECGPGFVSTINYLIPGVAFLMGIVALGETVGLVQVAALALILLGVWLIQQRSSIG